MYSENDMETNLLMKSEATRNINLLQKTSCNKDSIRFQFLYGFIPIYCFCQIFVFFCISLALWDVVRCIPIVICMLYVYYKCFVPKAETQVEVDHFLTLVIDLEHCESRKVRKNAEKALNSLSNLGFDSGDRYLEELNQSYKSSTKHGTYYMNSFLMQIITIASLYIAGHLLSAIVEYSKITDVGDTYYNLQLWITLGIHGTSCIFIIVDAFRLVSLMNLVDGLARDIYLRATRSECLLEAEIY